MSFIKLGVRTIVIIIITIVIINFFKNYRDSDFTTIAQPYSKHAFVCMICTIMLFKLSIMPAFIMLDA